MHQLRRACGDPRSLGHGQNGQVQQVFADHATTRTDEARFGRQRI